MKESEIEKYLRERVKVRGGLCWKFTSPGTVGVPDRIVMICGKVYFVELKRPSGRLAPLQEYRRVQLEACGQIVLKIDSKAGVDEFIAFAEGGH